MTHSYSFTYNPDGFLYSQVVDGGTPTYFVRDGANTLQERDVSNNVTRAYAWDPTAPGGIGGLMELTQGGQHYNYLYDGKGNVSAIIDSGQNVVTSYAYDEFGCLKSKSGTLDQPYMFSTKYYYPDFGGSYYGYRFYLAGIGKWMTRDPLGEKGGVNLYRAFGNNATNYFDPYGLETPEEWKRRIEYEYYGGGTQGAIDNLNFNHNIGKEQGLGTDPLLGRQGPDYISLDVNVLSPLGLSFNVTVDRFGNIYTPPMGVQGGKPSSKALSFCATGGKIEATNTLTELDLKKFLSGRSLSAGGGFWVGGNVVFSGNKKAIELGIFSPQVGATYNNNHYIENIGISW